MQLALSTQWMEHHPLTMTDLEYEENALKTIDLHLEIEPEP